MGFFSKLGQGISFLIWIGTLVVVFSICVFLFKTYMGNKDGGANLTQLQSKTWIWEEVRYRTSRSNGPLKQDAFSVSFGGEGKFSATTDCNTLSGTYTMSGKEITFSNIASTKMFCASSQEEEFTRLLTSSSAYHFDSGKLVLELQFNGGEVLFR